MICILRICKVFERNGYTNFASKERRPSKGSVSIYINILILYSKLNNNDNKDTLLSQVSSRVHSASDDDI